jgi:hypothetical protein
MVAVFYFSEKMVNGVSVFGSEGGIGMWMDAFNGTPGV